MMYPSIAKIRTFIVVGEQASFRKASEIVHLSQPAISAHVRDLEEFLGVPLLSRTTRSVRLTREGRKFLIRAKRALFDLQSVIFELRDEAELQSGRVTIACLPTIASSSLPTAIAAFQRRYPEIKIRVLDEVATSVNQRVLSMEADFGLGPRPAWNVEVDFEPLFRDDFIAVFPRAHELAGRKSIRLKDLAKYPLLMMAPGTTVRTLLEEAFQRIGCEIEPVHELYHHYTLGGMVEAGLGITVLPSMAISILGHPRLKSARVMDTGLYREIGILQRRGNVLSPSSVAFLATLREVFASWNAKH